MASSSSSRWTLPVSVSLNFFHSQFSVNKCIVYTGISCESSVSRAFGVKISYNVNCNLPMNTSTDADCKKDGKKEKEAMEGPI